MERDPPRGLREVNKVLEWLPKAPHGFDPSFVHSLETRLESGLALTDKQFLAIQNIIDKFRIGPEEHVPKKSKERKTFKSAQEYYKNKDLTSHYY